jgi:hypothetical protein
MKQCTLGKQRRISKHKAMCTNMRITVHFNNTHHQMLKQTTIVAAATLNVNNNISTVALHAPGCFSTAAMLPSVMLSPIAGTTTSALAGTLVCRLRTRLL